MDRRTSNGPERIRAHQDASPHEEAPSIFQASSVSEIRATLAQLKEQEAVVTTRLDSLIATQKDFSRQLGRLDLLRARLGPQMVTTRALGHGMLSDAASTAQRISGAVKQLDLEQSRVKATLEVVEQVAELKACVLGVTGSMGAPQDWEKAAGYLHRASHIPPEIVHGQFAEQIVPTAEVPDPPGVTLQAAAASLCALFVREFDKAAKAGDGARVTRFFKLFPLIGRQEVGLDIYGRYVCQGVAARSRANLDATDAASARKDGFFYAHALAKLFEHIAQIVDGHGGLVERHYGARSIIKVVERLQLEADIQGGIILDTWSDERQLVRRLSEIKSYAFSFLVQSFLPQPKAHASAAAGSRDSGPARAGDDDDGADMKEIDGTLCEAAVMLGRWSLYCRFLARTCQAPVTTPAGAPEEANRRLQLPPLLTDATLHKKINDRLIAPFATMTIFFFRRSVERAFQLDEQAAELTLDLRRDISACNPPYLTSAVDDVMYIVNQVLQRSLATSQRAVVASVVPPLGRVLGSDFVGMIQRKMRDESYPKAAAPGAAPPEDKILAFLVLINNLDMATEYLGRIIHSRAAYASGSRPASGPEADDDPARLGSSSGNQALDELFPFDDDAVFVAAALRAMEHSFATKTRELLADGIAVVFDRVLKPRLRPIMAHAFRDVDYARDARQPAPARPARSDGGDDDDDDDDARHAHDERHSLVAARFERGWQQLMRPIGRILTERNYDRLLAAAVGYLASKVVEKRVWSLHGRVNERGAVRLERDVAGIVTAVVRSGARYGLRHLFARCTQICLVLTLEPDEWLDLDREAADADGEGKGERGREEEREEGDEEAEEEREEGDEEAEEAEMQWSLSRDERRRARAMLLPEDGSSSSASS
ncbi:MAG: hypothetical protein M1826_000465 [Phylliscum demangeonii]|nr:MAG: hypothetical protein M1826_000465 [Phylliscum demangeonii]